MHRVALVARSGPSRSPAASAGAGRGRCRCFGDDARRRQQAALDFYRRKREDTLYHRLFGWRRKAAATQNSASVAERNVQIAWYAAAVVVGALGATYAAVPLYKVFCQATGFGGTTQRVRIDDGTATPPGPVAALLRGALEKLPAVPEFFGRPSSSARVHTWTDADAAARLASLRPVKNADLVTVRFDTTVGDVLPWSFVPVQLDVKVVPGETALSFFRVTNHSDKAITGVATYNVYPPKVGLYFQKIQCFCFEEQRLLPGETVDMPVFFFIDPDFLSDPQVSYVRSITLSYTFFQTDVDDDEGDVGGITAPIGNSNANS